MKLELIANNSKDLIHAIIDLKENDMEALSTFNLLKTLASGKINSKDCNHKMTDKLRIERQPTYIAIYGKFPGVRPHIGIKLSGTELSAEGTVDDIKKNLKAVFKHIWQLDKSDKITDEQALTKLNNLAVTDNDRIKDGIHNMFLLNKVANKQQLIAKFKQYIHNALLNTEYLTVSNYALELHSIQHSQHKWFKNDVLANDTHVAHVNSRIVKKIINDLIQSICNQK